MLCFDLDGTLLRSDKTVSDYSLRILKKISECGTVLVPVTGRHLGGIRDSVVQQGISYAICFIGAGLYDVKKRKPIREEWIPEKIITELNSVFPELDVMADIFTFEYAYSDERNMNVLNDVDASGAVKDYIRKSRIIVPDVQEFCLREKPSVQKITVNFRKINGIYKNREKLRSILSSYSCLEFVTGGANNIEITVKSATKGKCITYLSEITGIPLSETAAIGDTENDISILKIVGINIAMKNADTEVKNICRFITDYDNNNDGAAKFFENNFL